MAWLNYDEHVDSLSTMGSEVGVTSPKSTIQTLPLFEEYTPLVTYPKEVKKTLGTPIEVELLNKTKLEEVGLNCNHNTPFSYRKVPSFDGPEPQPLLNCPPLDVSLGDVIGLEPPIKLHSPDSSRIKIVDYLKTQTPPSPHVVNSHPKGVYSYYNPGLESKEVSPLGEELSLFDRPKEVKEVSVGKIDCNRLNTGSITVKSGSTKLVLNSNSYLRDILGDILGKDMHYPLIQIVSPLGFPLCIRGTLRHNVMYDDGEESNHEDASDTGAAPKQQQQMIPQTTAISNIKLPILKKEEYDIWAMEMEHYLEYIDNEVWKVIQNGNSKKRISTGKDGVVRILSLVTAVKIQAVEKERKAKNILLMDIPKEHMRRFHGMDDAKEIWEAIRTRFGGNANSKKMQKAVFKQQFEAFKISNSEGLEKGYERFQQLLSQLEAHGAEVSAWSNLAMTMRTNPEIDNLSIDDLYNNLRVFEQEIQGAPKPSSSAQNVAFVSQSKSSNNKVKSGFSGAYSSCTPSTSSTNVPEKEVLAGFADEVIYSLFAKQTEDLDLLHEDLEQIDDVDIEEMDINWQIAMIAIRMKKFYKKTGRRVRVDGKTPVGFDKKKLECFNCHNTGHFARECTAKGTHDGKKKRDSLYQHQEAGKQEKNQMGLLTMDDGIVNWGEHTEAEESNHALMAISSSNEVSLCSKTCIDSYNKLKTLCDEQMNQLGDQEAQILAYSQAVKKLEAQLVTSQKQQLSLNEKLAFQANEIHEKDEKLKRYRRIGMKAVKEKEQLQKTVDSWKDSSKNLWRLINSGMSSNDKLGLGFEIQSNDEVLSYEEEMNFSVFKCSKEDSIGKPSYSRFTKTNDFKGVPPPLSGDYTPKPQEEIDDSLYVYGKKGPQKPEISVSDDNSSEHSTCQSNDSEGSCGNTSEHSFETESESLSEPNEMSKSSLSHLIKDCDYYEKKMAREAEVKRVFNTGNGVAKPVGQNLILLWPNIFNINDTGRTNINSVRPRVNAVSPKVNTARSRQPDAHKTSNSLFKTSKVIIRGTTIQTSIITEHPLKNMVIEERPQQNGVAERMNRTLIEAARTMLADSLLPTTFWAEAVSTACYIFNRIHLCAAKFDGKSDEGFLVGYSLNSKAYRVYNLVTKRVEVNLHVNFLEDKPNVKGVGYRWMFDIDYLTDSMNYIPVSLENQANPHAGASEVTNSAGTSQTPSLNASEEKDEDVELIVVPSTKKAFSTDTSEDNPKIQAFRRELEEIALKHLGKVSENTTTTEVQNKSGAHALLSHIQKQQRNNHKDQQHCLFACFLSQEEPKKIAEALQDDTRTKEMKSVVVRNTARIAKGVSEHRGNAVVDYRHQDGDVSAFLYGTIDEEVYVSQPPGFVDPVILISIDTIGAQIDKTLFHYSGTKKDIMLVQVYVDDIIFGSTNKSWCDEFEALMKSRFQMSSMGELTFFLAAITPMETKVPLTKDEEAIDVDVHLYRSMIGSLMYLTASRPDIMYAVCVCSRFQGTPFDLEAFSDSDYGGSNLDRKSTTGGCQFLGQRLISWQCKKQTIVATLTTEAEYVAAANCCGQVLWVQNQLLDYGFNFMNTKIHIDNESTICIVKNPVYHSKTKHIEIRHHFIRDCYEKKLISVEKIHTDLNVADLLTKPFDGPRFNYLVVPTSEINATIDTIGYTITEASIRDTLQLEDATGITMLPNDEIFEGMGQMGYPTDGTFTFWKSFFTPQWRYLVHHLLHCISSKSGGWDQFGSNIATALICLSTGRVYNFSKLIFDGMVANLKSKTKFLMYHSFLQMILNIQTKNKHLYLVSLTKKIFGNMKRGFRGAPRPLLPAMLLVATNPNAGQERRCVAQSPPSSSTPPVPSTSTPLVPSTSSPLVQYPPPIPASIPTPIPIPETEPEPFEHTFEEHILLSTITSHPTRTAQGQMSMDELLQVVHQLISRIDSLETDLKQTKLTMGNALVKEERGSKMYPLDSLYKDWFTPSLQSNASGEAQSQAWNFKKEQILEAEEVKTAEGGTYSSPDKRQRSRKSSNDSEDTPKKSKEQILQDEASLAKQSEWILYKRRGWLKNTFGFSLAQRNFRKEDLKSNRRKEKLKYQFEAQHRKHR
ncbi:putative ribonuclease H-like domain-containing protein [Tanacetum coccineum]